MSNSNIPPPQNSGDNDDTFSEDIQSKINLLSTGESIVRRLLSIFPEEIEKQITQSSTSSSSSSSSHLIPRKQEYSVDHTLTPKGLLNDSEQLREFLKTYYRFLAEDSNSGISVIDSLYKSRDIDLSKPEYQAKFFYELAKEFSEREISLDKRTLLKTVSTLYAQKGTPDAFKNLLKIIGEDYSADVFEPWSVTLHTSDAQWIQEKYLSIRVPEDDMDQIISNGIDGQFILLFETEELNLINDEKNLDIIQIEKIDERTIRVYSERCCTDRGLISLGQRIKITGTGGPEDIICFGEIIESPVSISVNFGGKDWQFGQNVILFGNGKDTIARITKVDKSNNNSAQSLEIIQPGFDHKIRPVLNISPYNFIPFTPNYGIIAEPNPGGAIGSIKYTINLSEEVTGIEDLASGFITGDYFLQDYNYPYDEFDVYKPYNLDLVFNIEFVPTPRPPQIFDTDVSFADWQESIAQFEFEFGPVGYLPGYWINNRSEISSDLVRIQDGFYYQLFSYVVISLVNFNKYQDIAKMFHPAGLEQFLQYIIEEKISVFPSIESAGFIDVLIDLFDLAETLDEERFILEKYLEDYTSNLEPLVVRLVTEDGNYIITEDENYIGIIEYDADPFDINGVVDFYRYSFQKPLEDSQSTSDTDWNQSFTKNLLNEPAQISDDISSVEFDKYRSDVILSSDEERFILEKYLEDYVSDLGPFVRLVTEDGNYIITEDENYIGIIEYDADPLVNDALLVPPSDDERHIEFHKHQESDVSILDGSLIDVEFLSYDESSDTYDSEDYFQNVIVITIKEYSETPETEYLVFNGETWDAYEVHTPDELGWESYILLTLLSTEDGGLLATEDENTIGVFN